MAKKSRKAMGKIFRGGTVTTESIQTILIGWRYAGATIETMNWFLITFDAARVISKFAMTTREASWATAVLIVRIIIHSGRFWI